MKTDANTKANLWRKCAIATALTSGLLSGTAPAFASPTDVFHNGTIQTQTDTTVEFEFHQSNGAYQSTFGVINLDSGERTPLISEAKPYDTYQPVEAASDYQPHLTSDEREDFIGTPGNTVSTPRARFEFKAGTPYIFYLESRYRGRPTGTLYSDDTRNPDTIRRVLFDAKHLPEMTEKEGIFLRWDDTGAVLVNEPDQDRDFDDFIALATEVTPPTPVVETPASEPTPVAAPPQTSVSSVAAEGGGSLPLPLLAIPPSLVALIADGDGSESNNSGAASSSTTSASDPIDAIADGTFANPEIDELLSDGSSSELLSDNPNDSSQGVPEPLTTLGMALSGLALFGRKAARRLRK